MNEVQQISKQLDDCKLPEETQKIVNQELRKLKNLD
jgi:ATP-dependent Lon protease